MEEKGILKRKALILFPAILVLLLLGSCNEADSTVANFNVASIEGQYTAQMKMDFSGPRPAVSVFGGSLGVTLIDDSNFTLSIDFPDDYLTTELSGKVIEKIINTGDASLGGINFEVNETADLQADTDKIDVQTRDGQMKKAYATFLETAGDNLIMTLYLIEKDTSPIEFEFRASKN